PDRYPWYAFLIQHALGERNSDEALRWVDQGERSDQEQNQGRRANDYQLRRAQVLAKRGDTEQTENAFDQLIQRDPTNLRYRSDAAEAMLSMKQAQRALHFAEQGLAAAREQNN